LANFLALAAKKIKNFFSRYLNKQLKGH